jgi:hypothetical protein
MVINALISPSFCDYGDHLFSFLTGPIDSSSEEILNSTSVQQNQYFDENFDDKMELTENEKEINQTAKPSKPLSQPSQKIAGSASSSSLSNLPSFSVPPVRSSSSYSFSSSSSSLSSSS